MTITQFHNALLQGKGSCILAVRSDLEKYREEVLWACRELTSFDTQCEGTRSWFAYTMVESYHDREPFLRAAADALLALPCDGDWHRYGFLCALLARFMSDGDQTAWHVLRGKYLQLYHSMHTEGPPEEPVWHVRDNINQIIEELAFCRDAFLDIARDIGRLFLETDWFDGWDFDWLWHSKGKRYRKSLDRAAKNDHYLAAYIRVHEEMEHEWETQRSSRPRNRLSRRNEAPEEIRKAMERYLAAAAPQDRAAALDAFWVCPYPGDPAPLIADADSPCEELRDTAWRVLESVRHPAVREFALSRMDAEEDAFAVFITNYEPRDEALLMDHLRASVVDFDCTTWWHRDQLDVLRIPKPPKAALQFIYDTTYCSCCREHALRMMGKRRMLTRELLEECLYDSNANIRSYARRTVNRRKRRNSP